MTDIEDLRARVKDAIDRRKERSKTQAAVADEIGVSRATLSHWYRGKKLSETQLALLRLFIDDQQAA